MIRQYRLRDYNFRLVLWLLVLSVIGVLLVGSAESSLRNRQLAGVIFGITVMVIVSLIDFSWIMQFYWVLYILNIIMLAAVRIMGHTINGATRWISIAGVRFQPVELYKIILILFMFFGRVGGLTIAYSLVAPESVSSGRYPAEKLIIG